MTTDEALEYCKRFDDPKLREQMGTDFSNATGSVGALLALRAEIDALRGKVRELDAWLLKDRIMIAGEADNQTDAYAAMRRALSAKLRELGLITEARDE